MTEQADNLVGAYAVIARKPETITKDKSTYNDGEYIIVAQTPHSVIAVKASAGYDSSQTHSFILSEYDVIDPAFDIPALGEFIEELREWMETPKEERKYVAYVYERSKATLKRLERIYNSFPTTDSGCANTYAPAPVLRIGINRGCTGDVTYLYPGDSLTITAV